MKTTVLIAMLVALSLIGISNAYATTETLNGTSLDVTGKSCFQIMKEYHVSCFQYNQALKHEPSTAQHQKNTIALNWMMDIFAPDNSCNIFGFIISSSGSCTYQSIVLSQADFDQLKSNPSVLAVEHIQQSAMPAQQYCPVAIWTWGTQDASFQSKYNQSLVVPSYCGKPVPEFGSVVAGLVMLTAIGGSLGIGFRHLERRF